MRTLWSGAYFTGPNSGVTAEPRSTRERVTAKRWIASTVPHVCWPRRDRAAKTTAASAASPRPQAGGGGWAARSSGMGPAILARAADRLAAMATPPERPTLALIDASNYLYRAFYAIRGLTGPGGRPTNAVYGFLNMWRKYVADRKPAAVAVCFDRYEKTFREEMDAAYKAQRQAMPDDLVPQIEDAKRLCRLLGLAVLEEPGFEADDLIGSIAVVAKEAGFRAEICSADKDLFQLVKDPDVAVYHPVKDAVLDEKGVLDFFGVRPSQVIDVLALMGDSSDNIPGIRGIGEKTAKELIATFGSLDAIYERLEEVKGKRKELLAGGRDEAYRSQTLATVRCDRPLPAPPKALLEHLRIRPLSPSAVQELAAFYDEMGFSKVKKELLESASATKGAATKGGAATATASLEPATLFLFEESSSSSSNPAQESVRWIADAAGLDALVASAVKAGRAAVHVECGPGSPWPAPPLAAAVAVPGGETAAFALDAAGTQALAALFSKVPVVAHDAKRLFLAADALGIAPPERFLDAMLASYVVAPGIHAHDLGGDARGVLNLPPEAVPSAKDLNGGDAPSAATLASEEGRRYLAPRVLLPLALADALAPRLSEGSPLLRVLEEIELPLVPVLARMEKAGVAVDRGVLAGLSKEFDSRLAALEAKIHEAAGEAFNIGSPAAARARPLREARVPRDEEDREDEVVRDRLGRPRGARGALDGPGAVARPRVARDLEAQGHVRGRAAGVHRRGRAHPHALRPGRRGDGAALVERAEPPEHPDPHGGGPRDPPRVRRAARERSSSRRTTRRSS